MEKVIRAIIIFILLGVLLFTAGWGLIQYVLSRDVAEVRKEQELKARIALYEAQTEYNRSYVKAQKALAAIRALDAVKQEPWYGYTRLLGESFLNLWPVWILLVGVVIAWFQRGRFTTFENFEFDGIKTVIPPNQLVRLTELAIQAKGLKSYAEACLLQESSTERRFRNDISLFRSLKGFPPLSEQQGFKAAQDAIQAYVPTFSELLKRGDIAPGRQILFGVRDNGELDRGTWQQLYSSAIAGQSGKGKSSTARSIILQSLLSGEIAHFYIADPHRHKKEGLINTLGSVAKLPCITYNDANDGIERVLLAFLARMNRRVEGREACEFPIVLVVDELLSVMHSCPSAAEVIRSMGTEGRGFNCFGLFLAHSWIGSETGGTSVRDNLTSLLVHRMKKKQANTLLQDPNLSRIASELKTGEIIFENTEEEAYKLSVPLCTPMDAESVYQIIQDGNLLQVNPGVNSEVNLPPVNLPVNQGVNLTEPGEGELINQINARLQSGLKQKDMARLIGVSSSMLSQILSGKKSVSADLAGRIKSVLQLDNLIDLDHHRKK